MQLSPVMNMIGASLIVTGIVVHIVCLATPHYAASDMNNVKNKLQEMLEKKFPQGQGVKPPAEMIAALKSNMDSVQADINFGLWEMCEQANVQGMEIDQCLKWKTMGKLMEKETPGSFEVPDFSPKLGSKFERSRWSRPGSDVNGLSASKLVASLCDELFHTFIAWMKGAQSMAILGLLAAVATGVMAGIHMFVPSRGDRLRLLPVFVCIGAFVSGAIILCGDIIVAAKYDTIYESILGGVPMPQMFKDFIKTLFFLSWGFALDVVSAALMMLSGLFYVFAGHSARQGGMI